MKPDDDRRHQAWEAYWLAYRRRMRRRYAAVMACLIAPIGLFVIVVRLIAPPVYPAGDIRNELAFRLALTAFFLAITVGVTVGALRAWWRDRRPPAPPSA